MGRFNNDSTTQINIISVKKWSEGFYNFIETQFEFGIWQGSFLDGKDHCRYRLALTDGVHKFVANWGPDYQIVRGRNIGPDSNFPEKFPRNFYQEFERMFGVKIPNEIDEVEHNWKYSLQQYLDAKHPTVTMWNEQRIRRQNALFEEYKVKG